ncbi:MAG TPA: phytanoyl-CoA dioxygenase family protein [Geminicoccaceae bacterium]|nr:phytanoyl-CoA dioxygenase family protein [Geminicoccaceae bacterium]
MISEQQVEFYRENGFVVVEDVLSAAEVSRLREVTDEMLERARGLTTHDDVFDLEDTHRPDDPRVRRIKFPDRQHPEYARLVRHPNIVAVLQRLIGPDIRFDVSKLNMKAAGYGAAVEWHQDWAFYPHTNDDLCAVGIMMDDCEMENGPLLAIPGSHKGPILDHHYDGVFCGAINPDTSEIDFAAAVPMTGKAGSITIHHARTIHGSAPNTSSKMRRLLLHQYRAADAWPLLGFAEGWERYNSLLVTGRPSVEPRLAPVPVRLPLPPAAHQGSIYENQKGLGRRYFQADQAVAAS